MTYAERLKDPRWQKKRLEIFERDNFTCQYCNSVTKTLNVHHAYYVSGRDPWKYPTCSLSCLCDECHRNRQDASKDQFDPWEDLLSFIYPSPDKDNHVYSQIERAFLDEEVSAAQIPDIIEKCFLPKSRMEEHHV